MTPPDVAPLEGAFIPAGHNVSTVIPDMDFETYSEAGFEFIEGAGRSKLGRWRKVAGAPSQASNPLEIVGAPVYAEHPSTEILSLAYDLKNGRGPQLWVPGMSAPDDLLCHISNGGLIEAHNMGFEWLIWTYKCVPLYGWPALRITQTRCSMAKCRAFSLPGALGAVGEVLGIEHKKLKDGTRLLRKFSQGRDPTKTDPRRRITPPEDPVDGPKLYEYNLRDIKAESEVSNSAPDLDPDEQLLWFLDQQINFTGCQIDTEGVSALTGIIREATKRGELRLAELTGGSVKTINQNAEIRQFLAEHGVHLPNMQKETVAEAYEEFEHMFPHGSGTAREVLELRETLGSSSVKKLFSLGLKTNSDGRIREMFAFCGADRTGRFSGRGPQPQNLPNSGPKVKKCEGCGKHYGRTEFLTACPWCGCQEMFSEVTDWNVDALDDALTVAKQHRSLDVFEYFYGPAVATVMGCLRGLFVSAPGKDLICSDYSAIEAVVLACLAGEQWRIDVFKTHAKIYEASASQASGIPLEEILGHKKAKGDHHPLRKLGKVRELAGGYQGGYGAWMSFGAGAFMSEDEIRIDVKKWRSESPNIVKFWYGIEDAARNAVMYPGQYFEYRGIIFCTKNDVLYCRLLSGRLLKYHQPSLIEDVTPWGKKVLKILYWGTDKQTGKWIQMDTYGGKLTENITQATARDIMTHAMINVARAGYQIVLHVHDELVTEVPEGFGSVEELERLMATLPPWCSDWPVKAAGGWRGHRYRKD